MSEPMDQPVPTVLVVDDNPAAREILQEPLSTIASHVEVVASGPEAIAAVNITSTIEGMLFVIFIGLSNASAILIGNKIGAGEEERAFTYARRSLILSLTLGVAAGLVAVGPDRWTERLIPHDRSMAVTSPLQIHGMNVEIMKMAMERCYPIISTVCPMAGTTSP